MKTTVQWLFFWLCALVLASATPPPQGDRVTVTVYYESLCPDSKRFFQNQLAPALGPLDGYIKLDLVPFGNAQIHIGPEGNHTFTCQHGEEECRGNIIQTCVIALFDDILESVKFINCAFNADSQPSSVTECIKAKKTQKAVLGCADGPQGVQLETAMGLMTQALNPPQNFIPWITFDQEGSSDINKRANRDFIGSVCDRLTGDKPSACQEKMTYTFKEFITNKIY